jgi:CBS domain-containing protein
MPVFLLGSLFGRFVGGLVQLGVPSAVVPSYALVGAVAFSAGVTQTVSVTMIAVEMTGNINLLLPLLIVSVVGAGISKMNGLSIYDQGMLNKGLESFQLLLTETCGYKYAMEIMSVSMRSLSRETDVRRLLKVLEMVGQSVFPVVDEGGDFLGNKLIGTLSRREVFKRVQKAFEQAGAEEALRVLLPGDCKDDDEIKDAALEMEKKRRKREELRETVNATMSRTEALASRLLFDDGDAALDSKSSRARCTADAIPIETTYSPLVSQQQHEVDVEKGSRLWDAVDATARGVVRDIRRRSVNTEAPSSGDNGLDSELLLAGADGRLEELLGQSVDISTDAEFELNTYPYSITPLTPMEHVYVLFEMVKASAIFVLEDGKLRGMITPEGLLNALKEKASV